MHSPFKGIESGAKYAGVSRPNGKQLRHCLFNPHKLLAFLKKLSQFIMLMWMNKCVNWPRLNIQLSTQDRLVPVSHRCYTDTHLLPCNGSELLPSASLWSQYPEGKAHCRNMLMLIFLCRICVIPYSSFFIFILLKCKWMQHNTKLSHLQLIRQQELVLQRLLSQGSPNCLILRTRLMTTHGPLGVFGGWY